VGANTKILTPSQDWEGMILNIKAWVGKMNARSEIEWKTLVADQAAKKGFDT
jgi:hypothetical protein